MRCIWASLWIAPCLSPSFSRVDGLRQNGQFPPFPTGRTSLFLPRLAGFPFSSLQNNAGWMKSAANQSFMVFLRAIWHPCTLLFFEISTRGWPEKKSGQGWGLASGELPKEMRGERWGEYRWVIGQEKRLRLNSCFWGLTPPPPAFLIFFRGFTLPAELDLRKYRLICFYCTIIGFINKGKLSQHGVRDAVMFFSL